MGTHAHTFIAQGQIHKHTIHIPMFHTESIIRNQVWPAFGWHVPDVIIFYYGNHSYAGFATAEYFLVYITKPHNTLGNVIYIMCIHMYICIHTCTYIHIHTFIHTAEF